MFESIYEIDEKIDSLTEMLQTTTESTSIGLKDSISSLYKEKYETILEEKGKLESLLESGMVSENMYDTFIQDLVAMEKETEEIVYPFMMEAAGAITLTFLDREIEELKGADEKRMANPHWLKTRLKGYERINDNLIPFTKLKSKIISKEDLKTGTSDKIKKYIENGYKVSGKKYLYNGKPAITFILVKEKTSVVYTEVNIESSIVKTHEIYYRLYAIIKNISLRQGSNTESYPYAKEFIKKYKEIAVKKKSQLGREVKESVLSCLEKDQNIEQIYTNIKESVKEDFIGENMGKKYKLFVDMIYESVMLDHDNKYSKDW